MKKITPNWKIFHTHISDASWKSIIIELLIFIIILFSLRATINSQYSSDDLINSLSRTGVFFHKANLYYFYQYIINSISNIASSGRIQIGLIITKIPMLFFNITQYRVYVLFLICLNVWIFGKCVFQWTNSQKIKWISMLVTPLFFQFYSSFYHSPILNFYGLMQLVFLGLFLSLFFFWKFINGKKKIWLIFSGVSYLWGLISYEVSFVFIVIFVVLAYFAAHNFSKAIKLSSLHIFLFLAVIILNICLAPQKNYSGTIFSFSIQPIFDTTINQMLATIPLMNFWVSNIQEFNSLLPKLAFINNITLEDLLSAGLFLLALAQIHNYRDTTENIRNRDGLLLFFLGFLIILLPSILIGLSAKYQKEIVLGIGYIPVYIQYFGLIIMLIPIITFCKRKLLEYRFSQLILRFFQLIFILTLIFILLVNQQCSRQYISKINSQYYDNMIALQYSLQDDFFHDIPNDATIINTQTIQYHVMSDTKYSMLFFTNYSHKPYTNIIFIDEYINNIIEENKVTKKDEIIIEIPRDQPTYIVRSNRDPQKGAIFVGKIRRLTIDVNEKSIIKCEIDELDLYLMNDVDAKYLSLYESNNFMPHEQVYYAIDYDLADQKSNGRIYKYLFNNNLVDFNSVSIIEDLDNIDSDVYSVIHQPIYVDLGKPYIISENPMSLRMFPNGWYDKEDWGIWSKGTHSTIRFNIREPLKGDTQITMTANIFAPYENLAFVVYVNNTRTEQFSLPNGLQCFSLTVPKELVTNSEIKMEINIINPDSPKNFGFSNDTRIIGIGLVSFIIQTK